MISGTGQKLHNLAKPHIKASKLVSAKGIVFHIPHAQLVTVTFLGLAFCSGKPLLQSHWFPTPSESPASSLTLASAPLRKAASQPQMLSETTRSSKPSSAGICPLQFAAQRSKPHLKEKEKKKKKPCTVIQQKLHVLHVVCEHEKAGPQPGMPNLQKEGRQWWWSLAVLLGHLLLLWGTTSIT